MRKLIQKILKTFAKSVLKKYQPDIIGVTGSVGKTSTKEAIYAVLSSNFNVRRNIKNYNNEIGLPLSIIGANSGGRSPLSWLGVFIKAIGLIIVKNPNYPKILILEMAVDHPGDMKYLTELAPCKIGVVTNVSTVHLEHFKSIEKIAKEKAVLLSHLDKNGWGVLNADNEYVAGMDKYVKGRIMTYGFDQGADVTAQEVNISQGNEGDTRGLSFKLSYEGSTVPILLPHILGEHLIYSALAASAIGLIYKMNLVDIAQNLMHFSAPKGRMNIVNGIKGTIIIDDSYNASPESMIGAINALGKIKTKHEKYVVLGDMLELGEFTEEGHKKVAKALAMSEVDYLITVGERARIIAGEAIRLKMPKDKVFSFSKNLEAGKFVQKRIRQGDYILIKGSQGARMEKVVKEIMAEPLRAKELLVRQEKPWI
ncbi:MAG: Mur ligase family protein [Patescibacteria group bacterium]|jgi:UDP-N-acetylmuramoyl-tripeptide--D-alanyl-D-alanine ligase